MGKKHRSRDRSGMPATAQPAAAGPRANPAGNFKSNVLHIVAVAVVLLLGALLRVNYSNVDDFRGGADEGFYVRYGAYMATEKGATLRALSEEYIRNAQWQQFPNPLRAGHILLSAWWMKLLHRTDFVALAAMSCLFSILLLFLGYWFVRRLFDKQTALLALILFASSPLALAMGRRALQDSVVSFFVVLALYLFYEALMKESLPRLLAFACSFFVAVMVKETSVLLAVFFAGYLLYEKAFCRKELALGPPLAALAAAFAATGAAYYLITGGFGAFSVTVRTILLSPSTNRYAIEYQTGSLARYLYDFWLISPATAALGVGSIVFAAVTGRLREGGSRYMAAFFVIMYILFSFFSKNLRYVMALDVPLRLFAALAVWSMCSRLGRFRVPVALAITLVIAVFDVQIFRHLFVVNQVYDPVTKTLEAAWRRM